MNNDTDIFLAANLGSEITRFLRAKEQRDKERVNGAYARACGIIEELTAATDSAGGRAETAMIKSILDDFMREDSHLVVRPESLRAYFLPFTNKVLNL